ncbi:MAG: pentapeptide repeat-containing protein [Hyphomicrobiaceae bacterium]
MTSIPSCLTDLSSCGKMFLAREGRSVCAAVPGRTFLLTAYLFDGDIDPSTGTSKSMFSRNLIVTDKRSFRTARTGDGVGGRTEKKSGNPAVAAGNISLRGRNLCHATLDRSNFRGADFTAADLTGASLKGADLRDARLSCAEIPRTKGITGGHNEYRVCTQLEGADLSGANLEETDLRGVKLMNARLIETNFTKANLSGALLNRTDLSFANLEQTSLIEASLVDATFLEANLRGTDLRFARLEGARLRKADLMGANLLLARAEGATFSFANLQGANLNLTWLQGADFESAKLEGADLRNAELQGASFKTAILEGADLQSAKLQGANFKGASINFADLRYAKLWATSPPVVSSKANMFADLRELDFRKFPERDETTLKKISTTLLEILKPAPGETRRLSEYHAIRRLTPLLDTSKFEDWKCSRGSCPDYQTWDYLRTLTLANTEMREKSLGGRLAVLACKDTSKAGYLALGLIRRVARSSPAGVPTCLLEIFERGKVSAAGQNQRSGSRPGQSRGLPCPKESVEFIRQYVPRCPVAASLAQDPEEAEQPRFRYLETLRLAGEKQAREKAYQDWARKQAEPKKK